MPYKYPMTPEQKKKHLASVIAWTKKNPEKYAVSKKKYISKNRKKINAYYREYYKKHREKQIARAKAWNEKNKDRIRALNRTEARRKYMREWKARNPEKILIYQERHLKKQRAKAIQESLGLGQSS